MVHTHSALLDPIYDSLVFVNLYEILDIEDIDCDATEIKNAYMKLVKKAHPDQGGSIERFQQITNAYEILFNKETRKEYDLYYLKQSVGEYGDYFDVMKADYQNFVNSTQNHSITGEELDKLYADTFGEYQSAYVETRISKEELDDKLVNLTAEWNNVDIEEQDSTLNDFMENHKDINISDVFEYVKSMKKNTGCKTIDIANIGTLETLPGYSHGHSWIDGENMFDDSNIFSSVSVGFENSLDREVMKNFDMNDFNQWKLQRRDDKKITDEDVENAIRSREMQTEEMFGENEKNIVDSAKRKEIKKFFKASHLNLGEGYDETAFVEGNEHLTVKPIQQISNVRKRGLK